MSKFLDTQFSITGIKNFETTNSYLKYDLVDFEYYTGDSASPINLSGLFAWFNLNDLNNLEFNSSGEINKWYNSAPGHAINQDLNNTTSSQNRPFYNQNKNCVSFEADFSNFTLNSLFTTGDGFVGFLTGDRCWFIVYEFDDLRRGDYGFTIKPNIASIIDTDLYAASRYPTDCASSGFLGISGNTDIYKWNLNTSVGSQQFVINATGSAENNPLNVNSAFSASKVLSNKNIVSIIKNDTTNNLRLRNNGYELLNINSTNHFNSGCSGLMIGAANNNHPSQNNVFNYDGSDISYYEILGFAKVPTDDDILAIEKYLFEKHFTNDDGLYVSSSNFTASDYRYAPINITGSEYLTKNIDSIFNKTYGCSANFSTKSQRMEYGDNYAVNVIPNINNLQSQFDLSYDGLTDKEAKALIGFFQNTFEYTPKTILDSYESVKIDLFYPYTNNAKIYFSDLQYNSVEANLNKINIKCVSSYDSNLNYKGFFITGENVLKPFVENSRYFYNDVVYYDSTVTSVKGFYWFTGSNNTFTDHTKSPTGVNSLFTRKFYFKPDLSFEMPMAPKFTKTEFETSAAAYENYGINKTLLDFSFSFNNRDDKETLAILKFLDSNAGFKIFEMTLPEPYNKLIDVYCPEWNHTYKFKNNHDVSVKFIEFKGKTDSDIYFNTLLQL